MKAICDRAALSESLALVSAVVPSRTPKQVLTCVQLTADADSGLTLSGTDMEVAVTLTSPRVEVNEPGVAVVPADKLRQIVHESIDPTLNLDSDQDVLHITGQDSKFKVFGHPANDFPEPPTYDGEPDFVIAAADLHRLIALTIFATAKENSRYAINGVLLERDGKQLSLVATDGHRLALAKGQCDQAGDEKRSAIVPTKALNLLLRLFDDAEQPVKVQFDGSRVLFATDHAVLTSNLVEGNFPPYRDVIPKDSDRKATIATDGFVSAVRRAALLTNEESKGVRMAFDQETLTLSSRAPEMGEAEIGIPLADYSGEGVEIGFNPSYVLDALKVVEEDQISLEMKAANKPGVLRSGNGFLYVVMPVNLQ